jgi:serine protease inhibitor
MKKVLAGIFMVALFVTGCTDKSVPESQSINVSADFSGKTSSFAFNFWKAYEKEEGGSYFLSPLSLNIALGMLLNGAEGETKAEIQNMLGFSDADLATINASYAEIIAKLPHVDSKVTNLVANSVWHASAFPVESAYLGDLKNSFSAQVFSKDFGNAATVNEINKWASDNTNGKIKTILEKIEPHQVLFLLNALYFKGDWTTPFDKDNTSKGMFYGESKTSEQDFMYNLGEYAYADNADFQMLELPYGNEKYAFVALLPKAGSVSSLISGLSQEKWNAAASEMKKQKIEVWLPKFEIETSKSLSKVLNILGMKKAFTDAAELGKISKAKGLLVDFVKQDTYLSVDEKGSEAAAVTSIGVGVTSVPTYPQFRGDKPFAFAIVEKTSNTFQFIGKIADL